MHLLVPEHYAAEVLKLDVADGIPVKDALRRDINRTTAVQHERVGDRLPDTVDLFS
jgi:hypothetical protein